MRTFVITKDGIARVMRTYATDGTQDDPEGLAEVAEWAADSQAQVTSVREISEADIPSIRSITMRDAWEDDGANISVNMVKARANKIAYEVRPEMERRLVQARDDLEATEDNSNAAEQARVRTRRRKLRSLPATIQSDLDAIDTPEALEAWQPNWP